MKFLNQNYYLLKIIISGIILRIIYLFFKTGDITKINLGGDPCHHFNIAQNLSKFNGPRTDFVYSFWHRHTELPAVTDVYLPGFHIFSSIFLIISDEFFMARIISFTIFFLNILMAYLIAKELKNKNLGIISIFLIVFNYFHIENSTVFTTSNFTALIIQIYFYVILLTRKNTNFYFLLGAVTGYSSITFGGWQLLLLISLINIYFIKKDRLLINILKFLFIFIIIYLSWGIYTKTYFGTPFYSNLNFYPFINNWGEMMNSTTKPSIVDLLSNINYLEYIKNHAIWLIDHFIKFSLYNFPTFIFFISITFLPLIIYGSFKINIFGKYILLFLILYIVLISLASNAMGGNLWPRHFMPLLPISSILIASAVLELNKIKFVEKFTKKKFFNDLIIISALVITTAGIIYKDTFWQRNATPFYKFGEKVSSLVPVNSKIIYGLTVQDLWCVSKRQIIMDPVFRQSKDPKRFKQEVEFYNIDYLIINLSNNIYKRDHESLDEVLEQYNSINLSLIYKDAKYPYYLYKILK